MRRQQLVAALSGPRWWKRPLFSFVLWPAVAAGGFFWGRCASLPTAIAEPPSVRATIREGAVASTATPGSPVAYIYGTEAITREDLGEYLIARGGKDRVKNLINKKIIDHNAKKYGIDITEAEINAQLAVNMKEMNLTRNEFVNHLLKRYGKSEFEWKEDVIRPRLVLERMSRSRVSVTREDLAAAYEAYYGEKVDCLMIMWPKDDKKVVVNNIWPKIRFDEKEFDHAARMQPSPSLAAAGGHVKPLGKHTVGDAHVEKVLFSLRPGEVSEVLETPEGLVVFKCLGRVPPDASRTFDQVRAQLEQEVLKRKVAVEVNKLFQELLAEAKPRNFLEPGNTKADVESVLEPAPRERNDSGKADQFRTPKATQPGLR